jgi:hypothetical protein
LRPGQPAPPPEVRSGSIPVDQVDAWLNELPKESVRQLLAAAEVRYDHRLPVGESFTLIAQEVESQYTWVLTDIEYYALVPTTGMQSPPKQLPRESLVGLVTFGIKFAGKTPMRELGLRLSPYSAPFQTPFTGSGWPWLNTFFGPQRMPSFALYAKSGERITVEAKIENQPRFPISKIGVNLHGFTISESLLNRVW